MRQWSGPRLLAVAVLIASPVGLAGATEEEGGVPSFESLLAAPAGLRADRGGHPRVFFDARGLAALRERAQRRPADWQRFLAEAAALRAAPPEPPAQGRGVHYRVGLALSEPAFAFAVGRDPAHLAKAREWMAAAMAYEPWGYAYSKPNQDIPAAFLLYGLTFAYDLLHDDLAPEERERVRSKIAEKASLLFEAYRPRPRRRYSFSQNHTFINAAALGFAGIALHGERPEAEGWFVFSRAVFDRVVRTYSPDGYYYEGYHYFEFSVPWIVHYLDALAQNTGEDWYGRLLLDRAKLYVAHSLLPGGRVFDFGDSGRGAAERAAGRVEFLGAHNILYRLAARYRDPEAAAVADWATSAIGVSAAREPLWTFVWREGAAAASIDAIPRHVHFANADVVYHRSGWGEDTVALAFRCGPPEGHHATTLLAELPEWRLSTGHAHPDAASFILFARGRYLTGDAGYTGVKMTEHHNAILVDGRGQASDGRHEVFREVPYSRLDRIRIVSVSPRGRGLSLVAEAAAAYPADLSVRTWRRELEFDGASLTVTDVVETEVPRSVTFLLHADEPIHAEGDGAFSWPGLRVRVVEPARATALVEPQWVIAQGRPGSVEKGEREQRGWRLAVSVPPARRTRFVVSLVIADEPATDRSEEAKARGRPAAASRRGAVS